MTFVTHPEEMRRILSEVGWPIRNLTYRSDGFPEPEVQMHYDAGPDPPAIADIGPPHWGDYSDPPHWEE